MDLWCSEIAASPEAHGVEGYRFNDGKVSPGGVFIGGRMHLSGAEVDGKHGRWYSLEWHKQPGKSRLVQVTCPDETRESVAELLQFATCICRVPGAKAALSGWALLGLRCADCKPGFNKLHS